ncbi:hypothetical protein M426DRAFT_179565 [Hypoxylon sp. CI-4A]|nr:hypothetical protein M426DRAFT_179565 [Hypoxylon sp. CI-4A]
MDFHGRRLFFFLIFIQHFFFSCFLRYPGQYVVTLGTLATLDSSPCAKTTRVYPHDAYCIADIYDLFTKSNPVYILKGRLCLGIDNKHGEFDVPRRWKLGVLYIHVYQDVSVTTLNYRMYRVRLEKRQSCK